MNRHNGRKTKLTPEIQAQIIDALKSGLTVSRACQSAGVDESTYYRWLQKGEEESEAIYCKFRDAILQAEKECQQVLLKKIQGAQDWRSGAWILERRYPDEWGDKIPALRKELEQRKAQNGILMEILKQLLTMPGDSSELHQCKQLICDGVDRLRLEVQVPVDEIKALFEKD